LACAQEKNKEEKKRKEKEIVYVVVECDATNFWLQM